MARRKHKTAAKSPAARDLGGGGEKQVESLRALARALVRHGIKRSHAALANIVKDTRWYDAGFYKKAPWPEKQLPAMARWISEHLQEDRSRHALDEPRETRESREERRLARIKEDKDFATATLDGFEKLIGEKGLSRTAEWAKLLYTVEKAANEKLDRMIKEKAYVKREEIEIGDAKKREAIKRGLERLAQALRQVLADISDPARIEETLTGAFRQLCNQGFGGKW